MGNKPSAVSSHRRQHAADPTKENDKWSEAPHDIVTQISDRFDSIEDYVSLRRVCTSWRSAAAEEYFNQSPPIKLPFLMLETISPFNTVRRHLFSLSNGKLVHQALVPKTRPPRPIYFESLGWLFNIELDFHGRGRIYLSHPISGFIFILPIVIANANGSCTLIKRRDITKVVLSTHNITSPDFAIVIAYIGTLCLWRPGAVAWTKFDHKFTHCTDVAYHKGHLYVVNDAFTISRCKIEGSRLVAVEKVTVEVPFYVTLCLVEPPSTDSLLVVCHDLDYGPWRRTSLYVLEVSLRNGTFQEVKSLGDRTILLGGSERPIRRSQRNGSTLVKACGVQGIRANCIYFTSRLLFFRKDEVKFSNVDLYYYNLDDGHFHPCNMELSRGIGSVFDQVFPRVFDQALFVTPTFH